MDKSSNVISRLYYHLYDLFDVEQYDIEMFEVSDVEFEGNTLLLDNKGGCYEYKILSNMQEINFLEEEQNV